MDAGQQPSLWLPGREAGCRAAYRYAQTLKPGSPCPAASGPSGPSPPAQQLPPWRQRWRQSIPPAENNPPGSGRSPPPPGAAVASPDPPEYAAPTTGGGTDPRWAPAPPRNSARRCPCTAAEAVSQCPKLSPGPAPLRCRASNGRDRMYGQCVRPRPVSGPAPPAVGPLRSVQRSCSSDSPPRCMIWRKEPEGDCLLPQPMVK